MLQRMDGLQFHLLVGRIEEEAEVGREERVVGHTTYAVECNL